MFSFIRHCQIVFQNIYAILHSHQQWMGVPLASHSCHQLVLSMFLILAILIDVQWYLDISICDSLMMWCWTSFHVPVCHLYIFFGEVSVKVFGPFLNWVVSLLLSFKCSLYSLDTSPLPDVSLANVFFQSVANFLHLQTLSCAEHKFLILMMISYFLQGSYL